LTLPSSIRWSLSNIPFILMKSKRSLLLIVVYLYQSQLSCELFSDLTSHTRKSLPESLNIIKSRRQPSWIKLALKFWIQRCWCLQMRLQRMSGQVVEGWSGWELALNAYNRGVLCMVNVIPSSLCTHWITWDIIESSVTSEQFVQFLQENMVCPLTWIILTSQLTIQICTDSPYQSISRASECTYTWQQHPSYWGGPTACWGQGS
jgi:hypothetical protein